MYPELALQCKAEHGKWGTTSQFTLEALSESELKF